jgi:metallophosphoesterase (TIGR00282 family)
LLSTITILFVGDVVGSPGRRALAELLPGLRRRYQPHAVIANAENSAAGFGLTYPIFTEYQEIGIDVLTSGNHIWDRKEVLRFIDEEERLLRPINYPDPCPGHGSTRILADSIELVIINLMGRVFMRPIDCPFKAIDRELAHIEKDPRQRIIFVDFHAEASSEKVAMGRYLDGRVGAMVGTHTHVQTADERILAGGTAYLTDVGMTGAYESVIGMDADGAIERFLTGRNVRLNPARRGLRVCATVIRFDRETGQALSIERVNQSLEPRPAG